ncbi:aldo/keto reductase [Cyclobacterium salsum]|uniref:aldo/keto reductase n=1 Tax=Cyclobacterium salsum TaxID=2666329 RepID=UPI001391A6D4|nr:aldo/keto reductase [Cyclobacterium salsum]
MSYFPVGINPSKSSAASLLITGFVVLIPAKLGLGIPLLGKAKATRPSALTNLQPGIKPEWRNKKTGMAYRRLGNTGIVISEVVNGGDPARLGNLRMTEIAMERGLNYLDRVPSYGNGECEECYAKIIDNSAKREKMFMTTKVSGYTDLRNNLYREFYDGLHGNKQEHYQKKSHGNAFCPQCG